MIDWLVELRQFYAKYNEGRLDDVSSILKDFRGYEEALWEALTRKYDVPHLQPLSAGSNLPLISTPLQRVIRMLAHYAPGMLCDVPQIMEDIRRDGTARVFASLVKKFGDEPPVIPTTAHERVLVLYATYGALDRVRGLPSLLASYSAMEEVLFRRLTAELGPEPHTVEGNPSERLRRIFDVYDPDGVRRIPHLLTRFRGRELHLLASLQRRYGREPTADDVRQLRAAVEVEQQRRLEESTSGQQPLRKWPLSPAVTGNLRRENLTKRLRELDSRGPFVPLVPSPKMQRPECMQMLRAHLENDDHITASHATELVTEIVRLYERVILPHVTRMLQPHIDAGKTNDFLALLDCMYANAEPTSLRVSLRRIVSLLEMKYGTGVEEIFVAGGVESFLQRTDTPASRDEWAVYLTLQHGSVTEAELAARNRLRAYYMRYNPGVPVHEVDLTLSRLGKDPAVVYDMLRSHYGPEPSPLPVDLSLVRGILSKNDPEKLKIIDVVVEAHMNVGDDAETVIKRIERTYGTRPSQKDDALAGLMVTELEDRFDIFVSEMRLRQTFRRLKLQMDFPDVDVVRSIIADTVVYRTDAASAAEKEGEEKKGLLLGPFAAIGQLEADESAARRLILEASDAHVKQIIDAFAGVFPDMQWWDCVLELDELLRRLFTTDDEVLARAELMQRMSAERKELQEWLEVRLLWRAKWKHDEEVAKERQQREELRQLLAAEDAAAVTPSPPLPFDGGGDHNAVMTKLNAELHEQVNRLMDFSVKVEAARRERRDTPPWNSDVSRLVRGDYHQGCVFHRSAYRRCDPVDELAEYRRRESRKPSEDDMDWETEFYEQCLDYVGSLFAKFEPRRLPEAAGLLKAFAGREQELVAALEQQYDVANVREQSLRMRVQRYYRLIGGAPHSDAEVDEVLARFRGDPESSLWAFLYSIHGVAPPEKRAPEVRKFLIDRLRRFFEMYDAPRIAEASDMIDRCTDYNCNSLFAALTEEYGPEAPDMEVEVLRLKLLSFYRARGLVHVLPNVRSIAKRFVGRLSLLRDVLWRKFNADFDYYEILSEDLAHL